MAVAHWIAQAAREAEAELRPVPAQRGSLVRARFGIAGASAESRIRFGEDKGSTIDDPPEG
jgi:hypothetical protein